MGDTDWHSISSCSTFQWIQYKFAAPQTVIGYSVTGRQGSLASADTPSGWNFEGSLDGSAWTVLDEVTNQVDWTGMGDTRTFGPLTTNTAFMHYRLYFPSSYIGSRCYIVLGQVQLYA